MTEYLIQDTTLTAIADAIRAKTGSTEVIDPAGMAVAIEGIESGAPENVPCVFIRFAAVAGAYDATYGSLSLDPTINLPLNSNVIGAYTDRANIMSSTSFSTQRLHNVGNVSDYCATTPNIKTTSSTKTATTSLYQLSNSGSSYRYRSGVNVFIILFTMPGIYCKSDNGNTIMYADELATEIPGYANLPNLAFHKIDLSMSNISTLPAYFMYNCTCNEILLPANLTSVNTYALYGNNLEVLDFSKATSVPTLANAQIKTSTNLEIRVPSELYDEWIATTNWSNYADYIVAV